MLAVFIGAKDEKWIKKKLFLRVNRKLFSHKKTRKDVEEENICHVQKMTGKFLQHVNRRSLGQLNNSAFDNNKQCFHPFGLPLSSWMNFGRPDPIRVIIISSYTYSAVVPCTSFINDLFTVEWDESTRLDNIRLLRHTRRKSIKEILLSQVFHLFELFPSAEISLLKFH